MEVEIIQHDERNILVNGKEVYKDLNDKWVTHEAISTEESKAFREYLRSTDRKD